MNVERSEQIDQLAEALAGAQAMIQPAPKDSVNPHFKSRYADLAAVWEACRGPLSAQKLAVVQAPETLADGNLGLRTTLMHASGQWISSTTPLLFEANSMQALGSAMTYARRYALSAMVGVVADLDDDGQAAGVPTTARFAPHPQANGQARPPREERAPSAGGGGGGNGRAPTTGRALFAWCKDMEQKHQVGVLKYLTGWAKLQDFPPRMTEWDAEQVSLAHAEAVRKLQSVGPDRGDAYEEALAR